MTCGIPAASISCEMLCSVKPKRGLYIFAGGSLRAETVTELWRQKLSRAFKATSFKDGHPHAFDMLLPIQLLQAAFPMEEVSILLGHGSSRITERHYGVGPRAASVLRAHVEKNGTSSRLCRWKEILSGWA